MRFRAGRALRGNYVERGGGAGDRSVRFVAEASGRFAIWNEASGVEARSDGRTVWSVEDGVAAFIGPVPPAGRGGFGVVAPAIAEMLHPESAYIEAAFADPDTRDEELDMGQVRISGSQSSIVYDRSIDIIHEYTRPDGLERRLVDLEVIEPSVSTFRWDGPVADPADGTAVVTTVAPIGSLEAVADVDGGAAFAARLEHRTEVLSYCLDGPGAGTGGVSADECVAWALERTRQVSVLVDLASGETRCFDAGDAVPVDGSDGSVDDRWEAVRPQGPSSRSRT